MSFLFKLIHSISTDNIEQPTITSEVICDINHLSISFLKTALSSIETRESLFNDGITSAKRFLELQLQLQLENSV